MSNILAQAQHLFDNHYFLASTHWGQEWVLKKLSQLKFEKLGSTLPYNNKTEQQ